MSVALLLEMAASDAERLGVVSDDQRLTVGELNALADGGAGVIAETGASSVVYVGTGGLMLPLLIFSSARAARPFTPLNYRLSGEALAELIDRLPEPLVVFDAEYADVVTGLGATQHRVHAVRRRRRPSRARRRIPRPRRRRGGAVHLGNHLAAQSR